MNSQEMQPDTVGVTPSSRVYLERLEEYALLEGEPGQEEIQGDARRALEALHHVLGGGRVSITIEIPGNATVVEELNTLLGSAKDEWNQRPLGARKYWF